MPDDYRQRVLHNGQTYPWYVSPNEAVHIEDTLRQPTDPIAIPGKGLGFFSFQTDLERGVFIKQARINYFMVMKDAGIGRSVEYCDNFEVLKGHDGDMNYLPDAIFKFRNKREPLKILELTGQFIPIKLREINEDDIDRSTVELEDDDLLFILMKNVECMEVAKEFLKRIEDE